MNNNTTKASFPLFTILFLIFLTLKLAGIGAVASWSWWWVTSPLWIPIVAGLWVMMMGLVFLMIRELNRMRTS